MIRTRDFLLAIICIGFLLILITTTTVSKHNSHTSENIFTPQFEETELHAPEADLVIREVDRSGRIAWFREQLRDVLARPPAEPVVEESETSEDPVGVSDGSSDDTITGTAMPCGGYRSYTGTWPTTGLSVIESEGGRLVVSAAGTAAEQVFLVIPNRAFGAGTNCLPTDVVAVGQTGALIRNDDAKGYSVFTESTLIGYTLDGFPLYGFSDRVTDRCGGVVVDGTYRYYLSSFRDVIVNCFVASPVSLP